MPEELTITGEREIDASLRDVLEVIRQQAEANHDAGTVLEPTRKAMQESGLLMCNTPKDYGGWGFGVVNKRPLEYWLIVRAVARADTSLGQNFSVHSNQIESLNALGNSAQKKWIFGEVSMGSLLGAWASERDAGGCAITRADDGGYVINGGKGFCTNAGLGNLSLLYSPPAEAKDDLSQLLILPVDMRDNGVLIDREWWDQSMAMRATSSHRVRFKDVRVAKDLLIGAPGAWPRGGHNIRALCGFASNFLGTIEALFEAARGAITKRGRMEDPSVVQRIAEVQKSIVTLDALQRRTADAYIADVPEARQLSTLFRWAAGEELVRAIAHTTNLYGSMTMFKHNGVGQRILDATMLVRHESNDRHADVIGRAALNPAFDFKLRGIEWRDPHST